jgi:putative hydrolase of the HAD superfamily
MLWHVVDMRYVIRHGRKNEDIRLYSRNGVPMKYDAVIFDLFGTLVPLQDYGGARSAMAATLTVSSEDFSRLWNETSRMRATGYFATVEANIGYICRTLGLQLEANRITTAARIRVDFTRCTLTPRGDAVETLAQLKTAGYKIGLISDCSPDVPLLWQDTPFASLVDVPIFSCSVGFKKPDPRIYKAGMPAPGSNTPEVSLRRRWKQP